MITRYFGDNYIFFFYYFWNECLPQGRLHLIQRPLHVAIT